VKDAIKQRLTALVFKAMGWLLDKLEERANED